MPPGPAEFKQDVPCAKKGPLPTECPCLLGKGKHQAFGLEMDLILSLLQKEKGGSPGSCNPVSFSVFSQEDSWL